MASDDDDNTWVIDLESALLDGCTVTDIQTICKGKTVPESLRPEVWQVLLDTQDKGNQLAQFNLIFDLPNQNKLREDVITFVNKLGNDQDDKLFVTSDLESILTYYCKNKSINYKSDNGWMELMLPLLNLKLPRSQTYNIFECLLDSYVPKGCCKNGTPFHILRLLLQYHDPELCSFLDTKRITPEQYCLSWFRSLFAGTCSLNVVQIMWDLYFQKADSFFVFFLALIMVINSRERILEMKSENADAIINFLANTPSALEAEDVSDFCSLAHYYSIKTPHSFRKDLLPMLFCQEDTSGFSSFISQALCLPVSVHELVENATMEINTDADCVRFFLVDCRPAEQYNAGHLSTAFHLDCNLMLQEPSAFSTAVQGLLNAQRQALAAQSLAAGDHLCFVGSGRTEEDSYALMVVASFLKRNTKHVSMLDGGYVAIHDYFGSHMVDCLEEHDPSRCLVCVPNNRQKLNEKPAQKAPTPTIDLFSKLSSTMRTKSQEMKGKLIDYIVNPNVPSNVGDYHVSRHDRNGKRYRNVPPVFSIDDENYDENSESSKAEDNELEEIVNLDSWLGKSDVLNHFKCQEVLMNGYMHDAHLIVTESHLVILRDIPRQKGMAQIIVWRPLSTIVKITAKKRHPELITFKYGVPDGDTLLIKDMDRFLIPNANAATKVVSKQILKQLDSKAN